MLFIFLYVIVPFPIEYTSSVQIFLAEAPLAHPSCVYDTVQVDWVLSKALALNGWILEGSRSHRRSPSLNLSYTSYLRSRTEHAHILQINNHATPPSTDVFVDSTRYIIFIKYNNTIKNKKIKSIIQYTSTFAARSNSLYFYYTFPRADLTVFADNRRMVYKLYIRHNR